MNQFKLEEVWEKNRSLEQQISENQVRKKYNADNKYKCLAFLFIYFFLCDAA